MMQNAPPQGMQGGDGQPWMMMPPPPQQQQSMMGVPPMTGMPPPLPQPVMQQPMMPQQQMMPQGVMQPQPGMPPMQQPMQPQPLMQPQPQQLMQPPQMMQPPLQPLMQPQGVPQQAQYDDVRSLWVGDLHYWMDENYLYNCFAASNEVNSVKIIRNKQTGNPEGYGFVEFLTHSGAEKVLQTYNGTPMPNCEQLFRLNWASFGIGDRRGDSGPDHSIFVGDLAPDVTDYVLLETFRTPYPSVKGAKVVIDANTGRSKGYGFVRFGDDGERTRAMTEMNGVYCSSRPMRISTATPKKALASQQVNAKPAYQAQAPAPSFGNNQVYDNDPNNTTIFVGGLDQNTTDQDLRQVFSQFGEIIYVKIPAGKGCGFVQYTTRASAEEALEKLHGTLIGQQTIRLSWGRSPANKPRPAAQGGWVQPQSEPNQWNGNYYGYGGQGYEGYGYAPPQDPAAYGYGNYQGYGTYPQQVS